MKSPLTLLIKTHYHEVDQESGPWDLVRAKRLCAVLNITIEELAALIRVSPSVLKDGLTGKIRLTKMARLVLDLVERSTYTKYLGQTYSKSLFPHI